MSVLTEQEKKVLDGFQRLPPDRQRFVMLLMFRTDPDRWKSYQSDGEQQLRKLAATKGMNWDSLDDERRQDFVDTLLHDEDGT